MTKPRNILAGLAVVVALTAACSSPAQAKTNPSHVLGSVKTQRASSGPSWAPDMVYVYGHSFTMGPDNLTGPYPYSGYSYGALVGAHYGIPKDYNGRSGTRLLDTVRAVTAPTFDGSTARLWAVGNGHDANIVTLQNGQNDEASSLGSDPAYRDAYGLALDLTLGAFGAGSRTLAANATHTGTWTSASYPDRAPGGAMSYTKTHNGTMSFTVTADSVTIGTAASDTLTYATMQIEVDGATVGSYNGTHRSLTYTDATGVVRSWTPAGIHLSGLGAGSHTLTLRKVTNDTTSPIWVSAVYQQSATPPHVFLGKETMRNPVADIGGNFASNDPAYRAIMQAACADFSYVKCVDLNAASASAPAWNNATMVATTTPPACSVPPSSSDSKDCGKVKDPYNFHPNGAGMVNIATKFEDAIDAS